MNRCANIKTQSGFTIVEVMIVLAVSALLASSILIWQGSINDRARLADSIDNLTGMVMENRTWVHSTVNVNPEYDCDGNETVINPGANRNCVLFARVIHFGAGADAGQHRVHTIVANRDINFDDQIQSLNEITPLRTVLRPRWGLEFVEGFAGSVPVEAVAFIRNFLTGELETYVLPQGASLTDINSYSLKDEAVFTFVDPSGNQAFIHINESANSVRRSY